MLDAREFPRGQTAETAKNAKTETFVERANVFQMNVDAVEDDGSRRRVYIR